MRGIRALMVVAIALALALAGGVPGAAQEAGDGGGIIGAASGPDATPPVSPPTEPPDRSIQTIPPVCTTYVSTDVPQAIPDPGTVPSFITVPHSFTITDVNVGPLSISHTWDADLDVYLLSPSSTSVELFTDVGGIGDNFTNTVLDDEAGTAITAGGPPFTGSFRPEGLLSSFDGESAGGTWELQITDDESLIAGTLESWSLRLCGFYGGTVVVPHELTFVEGDSNNAYPFNIGNAGVSSMRYQQVYGASDLPDHQARITQIAFRRDQFAGSFKTGDIDVEIRLAHTTHPVNGLSSTFADNLESDVTLVYDGPLFLSSAGTAGPPRAFDIVIGLNEEFVYNGVDNLLMDVKMLNAPATASFDLSLSTVDATSRVYALSSGAAVADAGQTAYFPWGLVTQFTMDVDSDGDGCTDAQEQGANPAEGGQRSRKYFWDYFDTPDPNATPQRDRMIRVADIVRVLLRYGEDGNPGIDPLSTPAKTGYHTAYDRTYVGPNLWNVGAPDGMIRIGDVVNVLNQYGHDCAE